MEELVLRSPPFGLVWHAGFGLVSPAGFGLVSLAWFGLVALRIGSAAPGLVWQFGHCLQFH